MVCYCGLPCYSHGCYLKRISMLSKLMNLFVFISFCSLTGSHHMYLAEVIHCVHNDIELM